jgi:dTDP-4-amino-4,6-dideoxygalactose transaminase
LISKYKIPFNKPFLSGNEIKYIEKAVESGKISGDGMFTKLCSQFFETKYGFKKCLLTTSCTDALEMSAILLDIKKGDEVIMPSFTFVSTANAFVLRGAKIIFADSKSYHPNIDEESIENLITERTKAIVVVHYAGIACNMKVILSLTKKYNLYLIEDAAQAVDSYYKEIPLGKFGDASTFSFHETKNIISGEGGMIVLNNEKFIKRAEIIREKGTNRSAFFRGEVDKYNWIDIGSSFLPSDLIAAFLYAQIEELNNIQQKRNFIWNYYYNFFENLPGRNFELPVIPDYATNNSHMFYIICKSFEMRSELIEFLKANGILAVFHYLPLHQSEFYKDKHEGCTLPNSVKFSERLLRLPLYYEMSGSDCEFICKTVKDFIDKH